MRDLFEICGECRHLSDAQVVYRITNSEKASKEVERMLVQEDKVTIEDICQKLTPARRDMALAVVELYRRLAERKVNVEVVRSSKDIYRVMTPCMHDLKIEECWSIFLNQSNRIIRKQRISVGGLTATQVDIRVIMAEALKCNATAMILCHNHPSGSCRPSNDDNRLTECLRQASIVMNIRLLDHLVYAGWDYFSYADEGRL